MKKSSIIALFVLLPILLGVLALGLYFALTDEGIQLGVPAHIARGTIQTSTITDAEGNPRHIEARIAFEIEPDGDPGVSMQELDYIVEMALGRLIYEEMAVYNGLDHVRGMIREMLNNDPRINEDAISSIFVVDFASDFFLPPDTLPLRAVERAQRAFDGVFGGWGN